MADSMVARGGSLTKIGTGTLTFSGANTYTGPTAINGRVLVVNGSITSAVTVNRGGMLEGTGATGSVTVNGGGGVAPTGQKREIAPHIQDFSDASSTAAAATPSALRVNGDYIQNAGATLRLAIAGPTLGSFDQLIVTWKITLLSGAILELDFLNGFAPTKGEVFDLLSSGISSIAGSFTTVNLEGLAPGFEFDFSPGSDGTLRPHCS
jgi:autotransporter-associated beta strand protein